MGLEQIVGQERLVTRLRQVTDHFRQRGEAPDHILLVGPSGMGQTLVASAFAAELNARTKKCDADSLEKKGDLTAILTSLDPGDILALRDVSRLRQPLIEILGPALREFRLDLVIGQGPGARIHPYRLSRFTCVACVEKEAALSPRLSEEFGIRLSLESYSISELSQVVRLIARSMGQEIGDSAALIVAKASQGSPRQAKVLVRRLGGGPEGQCITESTVRDYLAAVGVWVDSYTPASAETDIDARSGIEFERLIGNLLSRMGFQVELTKASGDGGVDVVAHFAQPFFQGRYLIQCKRFSVANAVGAPVIREFYGAVRADHRAVKGIFVTTSNFTEQAREFAERVGIELIDREGLGRLLREHGVIAAPLTPPRGLF